MIPILIICYNNYQYVENTIQQLNKVNSKLLQDIIIVNNKSTDFQTIEYLKTVPVKVIHNKSNNGPWINSHYNAHIYHTLPDKFILTDPDLEFNTNLPPNFVDILVELSDKYNNCEKIGMALDISEPDKMYNSTYVDNKTIVDWESPYWTHRISNDTYELYSAAIDTTFCLITKNRYANHIRVAGNFTAKHLPWYYENPFINIYDSYTTYINTNLLSTTGRLIMPYITSAYSKIQKRDEFFFIKNRNLSEDPNMNFWRNTYGGWETETFKIFDRFLKKDKIFIDIGGWIGTTCMYGGRKSKHVYVVEADRDSFKDLTNNCKNNNINITCIQKAIFNQSGKELLFGNNKFLQNSKLNDSTSQLYTDPSAAPQGSYSVTTITVPDILTDYSIDPSTVSLIKVDIEGGEESILQDLYTLHSRFLIPLYVSFHYTWWSDKNLDRFAFLTNEQKHRIRADPFVSLLFA